MSGEINGRRQEILKADAPLYYREDADRAYAEAKTFIENHLDLPVSSENGEKTESGCSPVELAGAVVFGTYLDKDVERVHDVDIAVFFKKQASYDNESANRVKNTYLDKLQKISPVLDIHDGNAIVERCNYLNFHKHLDGEKPSKYEYDSFCCTVPESGGWLPCFLMGTHQSIFPVGARGKLKCTVSTEVSAHTKLAMIEWLGLVSIYLIESNDNVHCSADHVAGLDLNRLTGGEGATNSLFACILQVDNHAKLVKGARSDV